MFTRLFSDKFSLVISESVCYCLVVVLDGGCDGVVRLECVNDDVGGDETDIGDGMEIVFGGSHISFTSERISECSLDLGLLKCSSSSSPQ